MTIINKNQLDNNIALKSDITEALKDLGYTTIDDEYSPSVAYTKGQVVIKNTSIMIAKENIPIESFNANHWLIIDRNQYVQVVAPIEYDITDQIDGVKKTFNIPEEVTNDSFSVYYAGQRLIKNVNYTVDLTPSPHTLTSTFVEALIPKKVEDLLY